MTNARLQLRSVQQTLSESRQVGLTVVVTSLAMSSLPAMSWLLASSMTAQPALLPHSLFWHAGINRRAARTMARMGMTAYLQRRSAPRTSVRTAAGDVNREA